MVKEHFNTNPKDHKAKSKKVTKPGKKKLHRGKTPSFGEEIFKTEHNKQDKRSDKFSSERMTKSTKSRTRNAAFSNSNTVTHRLSQ